MNASGEFAHAGASSSEVDVVDAGAADDGPPAFRTPPIRAKVKKTEAEVADGRITSAKAGRLQAASTAPPAQLRRL